MSLTLAEITAEQIGTSFDVDGWHVRLDVEDDWDSNPKEFDCYDAEQISRFGHEWQYVVVIAKAYREGIRLGVASLGGVERGWLNNANEYVDVPDEYCRELTEDAIEEARGVVARLCKSTGEAR